MSYTIETIAERIGARRVGDAPATIDWLLTDSRSLSFPEETLFFALATKRNDGARYIPDLYSRGVRNFVVTQETLKAIDNGQWEIDNGQLTIDNGLRAVTLHRIVNCQLSIVNFLVVSDPLKALQ